MRKSKNKKQAIYCFDVLYNQHMQKWLLDEIYIYIHTYTISTIKRNFEEWI